MKKINKNSIVFVIAILFLLFGLCSLELVKDIGVSLVGLYCDVMDGNVNAFSNFTAAVENSGAHLRYRGRLLDINSAKNQLLGTRVVFKDDMVVVRADSGSLVGYLLTTPPTESSPAWSVNKAEELQRIAHENGAEFLYCGVAQETTYETLPSNYPAYNSQYYRMTIQAISAKGIPVLDTEAVFEELGLSGEEVFFKTDHHWKPLAGFYVSGVICSQLAERYDFAYDPSRTQLENYDVKTYENWFLGSYGKKVGRYFAGLRMDDFDLITPKFETDFTEEIPYDSLVRQGDFVDTMIHQENLTLDHYSVNTYAAYSGGDFRLQKITNNLNPNGATMVIIRASFGCVVTPFLALHAKELHVIDDREGSYPAGERVDLESYIRDVKPDYVIWLE